jgi:hypothetical protein
MSTKSCQSALQPDAHPHVVRRPPGCQLIHHPQPLLGEGQRKGPVSIQSRDRCSARLGARRRALLQELREQLALPDLLAGGRPAPARMPEPSKEHVDLTVCELVESRQDVGGFRLLCFTAPRFLDVLTHVRHRGPLE